ncbi:MAG: TIR domain-containing protein [Pseudomonadota bacterium]
MARKSGSKTRNYPVHTLEKALVIIQAIVDQGAGTQMDRLLVAAAVGRTPSSSEFKRLLSSSRQYGLTTGTEKADYISPTELGLRITKPLDETETKGGLVDACVTPDLFNRVCQKFNRNKLPEQKFFQNTLEKSFGVDPSLAEEVAAIIKENAKYCGILQKISGADYIRIEDPQPAHNEGQTNQQEDSLPSETIEDDATDSDTQTARTTLTPSSAENSRVFITHGKNKEILEQIKEVVELGGFEPIISVRKETMAKPIPDKVLDDMRSCGAAVIHVGSEGVLTDADGNEHPNINPNVLIEIGAAMALYRGRFILVVEEGVTLPSNLQGLYESRYSGKSIEFQAGMRILKALRGLKGES